MNIHRRRIMLRGASAAALFPLARLLPAGPKEQVVQVRAQRFHFTPDPILLKRGIPAVLELTSLDLLMGFNAPDFHVRSDIPPGVISRVRFTPQTKGKFLFHCDIFCGSGHEDMAGVIIIT